MRTVLFSAMTAVLLTVAAGSSLAADVGGQCFSGEYRSDLVNYSRPDLDAEIERRYGHAVEISQSPQVIASKNNLWTWANETKVSCGKVIGFLATDEINHEQITQCDCFYGVMFYLAN